MYKFLIALALALVFVVVGCGAIRQSEIGESFPRSFSQENARTIVVNGQKITCSEEVYNLKPVPSSVFYQGENISNVEQITKVMQITGFKRIYAVACPFESIAAIERKVSFEGENYLYKYISYKDTTGRFSERIAAYSITKSDGTEVTPLEELMLVLANKIPYNAFSGRWLPNRTWGPAKRFTYGSLSPSVIEKVATLPDGRIVNHVRFTEEDSGFADFFAVHTTKTVRTRSIETREIQGRRSGSGRNRRAYVFPTESELRERGIIGENARVVRIIGTTAIEDEYVDFATRTVAVEVPSEEELSFVTVYPYVK